MADHGIQFYDHIDRETYDVIRALPFIEIHRADDARAEDSESLRLKGNVHCIGGIKNEGKQHWVRNIVHEYLQEWIDDCRDAPDAIKKIFRENSG